ncbi:helix-turn-helix domain-containing protein [Mycolicibacterium frederiksbergense]|uniref:helix-turn-helix domain-containing protein n=1 Tax=Mycolicibacterium frederiksbergense TaxID=117567 RepID=UPI00265C3097|nr:helix-turn-helix transcriptional regulator [Mycolicibacterium frederiksbergense]MDO0976017.1 helix-turn-helix transcriptional regulator [Mycolicibacterium frederiksbergense]
MTESQRDIDAVVGNNLRRARAARGITMRQLADRLETIGAPMAVSVISESERGKRRVAVVDALAFSLALNVPLVDLLTPVDGSIQLTRDSEPIPNHAVNQWISGTDPWPPTADPVEFQTFADDHRQAVNATWKRPELMAISVLTGLVREAVTGDNPGEVNPQQRAKLLRREAKRVAKYVDLLADSIEDDDGR